MINIDFNNGTLEDFTVVLSDRNHFHKGQILNIEDFTYKANFNSANEISFTIYKEADGRKERLWNDITDFRLVWIKELDEYFEIYVNISESSNLTKKVTGTSLCEAELSQTLLRDVEINSESDIAREDYVITKFYNPDNPKGSLLHRVLEKTPHYYIKHVDGSLVNIQRTFSIDNVSIYDFLVGDCAEQFNCLFQFNSIDRSISVYDLYTVCTDCRHRGEFNDICPKCNSTNLKYYGEDTTILISTDNLTDEITFETDVDSVKNCFRLVAGDDNMTAAVIACNPNGSAYWYYFSQEQKQGMPEELVKKIESYDELVDSYSEEYQSISEELYDCIDKEIYYRSEMMPTIEIAEVTASTEAAKLTVENMSPIGLTTVTSYTSTATVNSALKNLACIFVKTGFVKVEVDTGNFVYVGKDTGGYDYGTWTGRFKVTNYSDEEDVAYSDTITIKVTDDYNYYLVQKIQKNIASNDSDDESLYDVLSITNLDTFKEALTFYCYNRLESFADAIQGVLNILIEENQSGTDAKYYNEFYLPYYYKLAACQDEMNVRAATIEEYETEEAELIKQRNEIQSILNFEKYLGEELYTLFCSYRREDTYQNDNFISDGLDNAEIFENALEFIELAKQEIVKSGEHQHSISSNLYNLLAMKEFAPIKDKFDLGNWIRCKVDDNIYRLRLISYEINGKNLSSINTEFSDMTKVASGIVDFKSILDSAQSMATTYQYVSKQASQGSSAQNTLKDFESDGLNSALINIKSSVRGETTFDNNGILSRSYDDIADGYSSEQLRITHNILAFTDDNWKSVTLGLGKHNYYKYVDGVLIKDTGYGLSSKFVQAGYIAGSQIIGGEIYSENYSPTSGTYINLNNGTFSFAGGKIKYNGSDLVFSGVSMTWQDIADAPTKISAFENDVNYANKNYVDTAESNAKADTANKLKNYSTTTQMNSAITAKADEINLSVSKTYSTKQETATAKSEAIATASDDATTKANNAKSTAIADTNEKLKNYSTTTEMNSAIALSADSIKSTVSKTYTTKAELADAKSDVISTASKDATNKANQAESNANTATDNKLKSYSTTTQMNSAINQKANEITLSVGQTYSTKTEVGTAKQEAINAASSDATTKANNAQANAIANTTEKLKSYSTTKEMESAIKLASDSINLSVSETYSTKTELANAKASAISTASQDATTKANKAESNAKADTTEKLKNYSTTTEMNSAIQLSAQGINLEVSKKVGNNEVISKINQTAETITISANKIDVDGVLNVKKLNALKITAGNVDAENITGTTITGKHISGGSINIGDKFRVDSEGYADLTGSLSCTRTNDSGASFLTALRGANLRFYEWCTVNLETTENDWYEVGFIGLTGDATTAIQPYNNINTGLGIASAGKYIGLGQHNINKTNMYYYMNFGLNPNGCTERHLFRGTSRFYNTLHCTDINLMPSSTETDISKFASLYVGTHGNSNNGVYIGGGGGLYVFGDISCSGTKHRVVDTEHYGKVGMNAFETPEPYFADIGSGIISEIGSTTIFIDPIFAETVDMNSEYQVFITSSSGNVYVTKEYDSFTVYGEAGTTFDWMICFKQKNYSAVRMEQINISEKPKDEGEAKW